MAVTTGVQEQLPLNSVKSLLMHPFARHTTEEKLLVKNLGSNKPEINISQQITVKDQCYKWSFCRSWFNRKTWLAGCGAANALFCFPCILFRSYKCDSTWTKTGLTDLKRLSERIKKHDGSKVHMKTA